MKAAFVDKDSAPATCARPFFQERPTSGAPSGEGGLGPLAGWLNGPRRRPLQSLEQRRDVRAAVARTPNSFWMTAAARAHVQSSPRKPHPSAPWLGRSGQWAPALAVEPRLDATPLRRAAAPATPRQPAADRRLRGTERPGGAVLAPTPRGQLQTRACVVRRAVPTADPASVASPLNVARRSDHGDNFFMQRSVRGACLGKLPGQAYLNSG